ncbi:hypothetical protein F4777DRAFT_598932 [Nemania sp. FL0916]|nr:hypothetical protein F4777DRAFT_598932 [Nemania sp. FL0916]
MAAIEARQDRPHVSQGAFLFVVNGEASVDSGLDFHSARGKPTKRPHVKSRRGCLVCKRRRVKCDERDPCSNCLKRNERCIHSRTAGKGNSELDITRPSQPQSVSASVVSDAGINLLHLELFSHFQRDLVDTLAFSEIWEQVLQWAFQEPYIMCAILCLAATHLSTLRPQDSRYSDAALQLLGKSAFLFNEQLSSPVTARNSEALLAVSILMHYISWSHVGYVEKLERASNAESSSISAAHLLDDPLLQLSFGVRALHYETFHILDGSGSVFLATALYSPRYAIEEAIMQQGGNPWQFVDYFMDILNNARHQSPEHENQNDPSSHKTIQLRCKYGARYGHDISITSSDPLRLAFEDVAKRLSLLFCLVPMSTSTKVAESQNFTHLQPDIERLFFSFPVHYSGTLRDMALQGDPAALIVLCHFYRAARILLTSPKTWWARRRSRIIESLILRDLTTRGLETCILSEDL